MFISSASTEAVDKQPAAAALRPSTAQHHPQHLLQL